MASKPTKRKPAAITAKPKTAAERMLQLANRVVRRPLKVRVALASALLKAMGVETDHVDLYRVGPMSLPTEAQMIGMAERTAECIANWRKLALPRANRGMQPQPHADEALRSEQSLHD